MINILRRINRVKFEMMELKKKANNTFRGQMKNIILRIIMWIVVFFIGFLMINAVMVIWEMVLKYV